MLILVDGTLLQYCNRSLLLHCHWPLNSHMKKRVEHICMKNHQVQALGLQFHKVFFGGLKTWGGRGGGGGRDGEGTYIRDLTVKLDQIAYKVLYIGKCFPCNYTINLYLA